MRSRPASYTGEAIAYFLTWTTYGTWLPGDDRGWIRQGRPDQQAPNPLFAEAARFRMKESEFRLSEAQRAVVDEAIRQHCDFRGWVLHALNVRTNHVHTVVTAPSCESGRVISQFKAWSTRRLKEGEATRQRFWTEGGSRLWIKTDEEFERVVRYVLECQDRRDEPRRS